MTSPRVDRAGHHSPTAVRWLPPRFEFEERRAHGPAWLVNVGGVSLGLHCGGSYVIGRSRECEIQIPDEWPRAETVSRRHVRVTVGRFGLRIDDLGTANGTWIVGPGGETLRTSARLLVPVTMWLGKVAADLRPDFPISPSTCRRCECPIYSPRCGPRVVACPACGAPR